MGQVCSKSDDDFQGQAIRSRKSIKQIRTSIKQMKPAMSVASPSVIKEGSMMGEMKARFDGNITKISDLELKLAKRRSQIVDYANQFMIYIAIVEHPMNDFDGMDQKIFEGIIKPQVIDYIKNDVQVIFGEIEQNLQQVFDHLVEMKGNKANTNIITHLDTKADKILVTVQEQAGSIKQKLDCIQKRWQDAANMQHDQNQLSEKIVAKIDKIQKVQTEISQIIDEISVSISANDVEEIEGKTSDMIIQKQIISTNTILNKVDQLKDQIDAGELDGNVLNSNIGFSEVPTIDSNPLTPSVKGPLSKKSSQSFFGAFQKKKGVEKTTGSFGSNANSNDRKAQSFVISCKDDDVNSQDSDQISFDEDMKPVTIDIDDGPEFDIPLKNPEQFDSVQTSYDEAGLADIMKNQVGAALLTDLASINKTEEKKLLKYNNLYDRLRKKKNDLEILLSQRNFQIHFMKVKQALHSKVNSEVLKKIEANDDLVSRITGCKKVCLEDDEILEAIRLVSQPADIKLTGDTLLTDKYSKVSESIKSTDKQAVKISKDIDKLQASFESLIKICDAYQSTSLYHYALKEALQNEVKMPEFDKEAVKKQLEDIKQLIQADTVEVPEGQEAQDNSDEIKKSLSEIIIDIKVKRLEMVAVKEYVFALVASDLEDLEEHVEGDLEDHEELSLVQIIKNSLDLFKIMSANQDTVNQNWKTLFNSKAKYTLNDKKIITSESISFLESIKSSSDVYQDLMVLQDILVHVGNVSDKLAIGNQVFINQNYSAQRIKKLAFSAQSKKNVELSKINTIEFVKKNYKGNWEVLKKHKEIKIWTEDNKTQGNLDSEHPIDKMIIDILNDKLQTKLRYLQVNKLTGNHIEFGDCNMVRTELCMLNSRDTESQADLTESCCEDQLCMTFGNCVLMFDQQIHQMTIREVQKQIQKKMMNEHNGITTQNIKTIQSKIKGVSMLTQFVN